MNRSEAIEKQLTDIGERDGITARDALQRHLPDQGAEKTVDCGAIPEIGAGSKEFLSGFAYALVLAQCVMGAEGPFPGRDEHAATPTLGINMVTLGRLACLSLGLQLHGREVGALGDVGRRRNVD